MRDFIWLTLLPVAAGFAFGYSFHKIAFPCHHPAPVVQLATVECPADDCSDCKDSWTDSAPVEYMLCCDADGYICRICDPVIKEPK